MSAHRGPAFSAGLRDRQGVLRRLGFLRPAATAAVALMAGGKMFAVVTQLWGVRGEPQISTPTQAPSMGYSYSIDTTPPWWAYPIAIGVALGAGTAVWRITGPRR